MGTYKHSHTSECMYKHRSSDVGIALQCMDNTSNVWMTHTSEFDVWTSTSDVWMYHTLDRAPMYGPSSYVWLHRYAPTSVIMGVFQVADVPTYGYVCTLPSFSMFSAQLKPLSHLLRPGSNCFFSKLES